MPRKHLVDILPEAVRLELSRRVFDSNFSAYERHEAWLLDQGYRIGKSSLHRFYSAIEASEIEKRSAVLSAMVGDSRANSGMMWNLPVIVQIINPATGSVTIIPSGATSERIEAAVRGLE
jgi:hypothetical protein